MATLCTRAGCLNVSAAAIRFVAKLVAEAHGWTAQTVSPRAAASVASPQARTCKIEYLKFQRGRAYRIR